MMSPSIPIAKGRGPHRPAPTDEPDATATTIWKEPAEPVASADFARAGGMWACASWAAIVWIEEMYAPRPRSPRHYWLLPLALTPGIVGVWLQDLRKRALGLTVLAYTAAMLVVELVIVCASFGRCL